MGEELEFEPDYATTEELDRVHAEFWKCNKKIHELLAKLPRYGCLCKCKANPQTVIGHLNKADVSEVDAMLSCINCGGYIDD
jgi:Rps23 Pro-64 3,4-dihydroxylase Tpa1-like proline 4-hydroxylase